MKLKNEPKRHRFWSKIQFFFPRMVRVLTSSKLNPNFSRFERSLYARHFFPQKRQRQRELSKKEREHTRECRFPFKLEEPIENRCKKSYSKQATNFTCAEERVTFPTPSEKFQSSPGYLAFFFAFDWLLALEFCLHTHPICRVLLERYSRTARKEKLNTGYTDFSSPTKM